MPKNSFHDYDPYDHICTINLKLDELIGEHNNLANVVKGLVQQNQQFKQDIRALVVEREQLRDQLRLAREARIAK